MTQTQLAQSVSDSGLYRVSKEDIANWEADRDLEEIDRALYSVIETALVEKAFLSHWSDADIHTMQYELSEAYQRRIHHLRHDSGNPFGVSLRNYREKLGLTQEQLFQAIAEEVLSGEYIADVEGGARPSPRFVLASATYFTIPMEDKPPPITNEFDRSEYIKLGMDLRSRAGSAETASSLDSSTNTNQQRKAFLLRELNYLFGKREAVTDDSIQKMAGLGKAFLSRLKCGTASRKMLVRNSHAILDAFDDEMKDHPDYIDRRQRLGSILEALLTNNVEGITVLSPAELPRHYHMGEGRTRRTKALE